MTNNAHSHLEELLYLYEEYTGEQASDVKPITGSASSRQYFHIDGLTKLIGVIGNIITENEAFIEIGNKLHTHGVNVPKIVAISADRLLYLQEDLGDISLFDIISRYGFTDNTLQLCRQTIEQLVKLQIAGNRSVDPTKCYPVQEMAGESIMWDLNYFKYCFLKNIVYDIDELRLENDFRHLVTEIEKISPRLFVHRDFQSRNILISNDKTWIIDFQGGRRGPAIYDIVSFLWQARAGFPDDVKKELLSYYLESLGNAINSDHALTDNQIPTVVIFRMLQVLGAYGFRGLIEKKQRFISYIPQALDCLAKALESTSGKYPYISEVTNQVKQRYNNSGLLSTGEYDNSKLTVTVTSFSYKKGLPADTSGNGGGYIFDCRAIHNPGKYEKYRDLTGDDLPVKEFLEYDGEITIFLNHCRALVDASVERYIERGFSHLSISFGCTGGQHRSVYSATHMANHLAEKYRVHVVLNHREQNIIKEFNPCKE